MINRKRKIRSEKRELQWSESEAWLYLKYKPYVFARRNKSMASSDHMEVTNPLSPPINVYKDPDDGRRRFLLELEFVQCLANPTYIHFAESDHSDWYDDESSYEDSVEKLNKANENLDREWRRRHNQFHTVGYRDGLIAGKETAAQEGFNIGFKDSVLTGYNLGLVRGITSAMACLPGVLREKLVETEETRNKFGQLHESVQSLSTMDALKLFYEDGKRKLSDQQESPSISILKNYHRLLQSLVGESPPLEGHLEVN